MYTHVYVSVRLCPPFLDTLCIGCLCVYIRMSTLVHIVYIGVHKLFTCVCVYVIISHVYINVHCLVAVNSDPIMEGKLKIVYIENYRVSLAERGGPLLLRNVDVW